MPLDQFTLLLLAFAPAAASVMGSLARLLEPHMLNTLTLLAEFSIAAVIYYEIEQNRASTFLSEAHGDAYRARAKIYAEYTKAPGATPKERTENFCKGLKANAELRQLCDLQFVELCRAQYMLRWSLFHRNLLVTWFPQVCVRLWLMLGPYLAGKQAHIVWRKQLRTLVRKSFDVLEKQGLTTILIYSEDGSSNVTFSADDLSRAKAALAKLGESAAA